MKNKILEDVIKEIKELPDDCYAKPDWIKDYLISIIKAEREHLIMLIKEK